MNEISKGKLKPFYIDWIAAAVFVLLLVFQPHQMAFYALRPSDSWLILCIILQYFNGYFNAISFKKRFLIEYFGLFIGLIAIVATMIQASYAKITLDDSFIFNFYRFFRFLLIFKFIENIVFISGNNAIKKLLETLTITGIIVVVLSFLEFYGVEPFKTIIMSFYYARPESELESYLLEVDRLAGVMGNPNTTALLLLVSMIYPLAQLKNKKASFSRKIILIAFLIAGTYVLLIMTGSRSSIITLVFIVVLFIIVTAKNLKETLISFVLMVFLAATGLFINKQFNQDSFAHERITDSFRNSNFEFTIKGFAVWTGRYDLWNHRFRTFHNEGNQLALLFGLGYTVPDQDYADNGFVSTFINNGIIGLVLKFSLYYLFIFFGCRETVRNFRLNKVGMINLVISLMAFALLMWEMTADLTDHYKLGQLFYLLLSITMIQTSRYLIPSE